MKTCIFPISQHFLNFFFIFFFFYQYQLKDTSTFWACLQSIFGYLFNTKFTSREGDICNCVLAECFLTRGKKKTFPAGDLQRSGLESCICTYLVRWRREYGFKGLKSVFLIPSNRNSYKENICIDMLRQGYHKSFSELFTLIQKWNALREAAGPGSAIWQRQSLEEQPDKLDQLYHFLTRAEAAQRAGKWGDCG